MPAKQFSGKYKVGDSIVLRIGDRKPLCTEIIECVARKTPHYKINWAKCGYHELLNTVPIPETSLTPN